MEQRLNYFFTSLEKIIDDPTSQSKVKIDALRVYGSLLPTISNDSLTVKHEVAKMDTSKLSSEDKIQLLGLLEKMDDVDKE